MSFSYNPLWKLLIDKKMTRDKLRLDIGISSSTMAKMSKDENVSMEVLHKICEHFHVQISEIVEYIATKKD
ncbi:helix-turn-helix domain-containing protein [Pelosinus propionicus]|uniref:DNA-binding transcriptional regulator, XRE family n=1 Tax=Pelosinus propionicus DSM 13327 TaxID=1123291 RepID=A0A1I4QE13_9FIRM|nr:helix-turn-helix transcriptional regulator [Pelosinus propionicus]SFM38331.1 DNA-binding transcriptional regulator, XRE family [Pelosinus propionicus DSM 13327]